MLTATSQYYNFQSSQFLQPNVNVGELVHLHANLRFRRVSTKTNANFLIRGLGRAEELLQMGMESEWRCSLNDGLIRPGKCARKI